IPSASCGPSSTKRASDVRRAGGRSSCRMRLIFWLNGWLVRILCVLAIVVMSAMALGVSAEVILRIFKFPSIIGLIELTEYGLFISTFFMAPHLLRTNEHIRVDIAMSRVDPAVARRFEYAVLVAIIAVSVVTGV